MSHTGDGDQNQNLFDGCSPSSAANSRSNFDFEYTPSQWSSMSWLHSSIKRRRWAWSFAAITHWFAASMFCLQWAIQTVVKPPPGNTKYCTRTSPQSILQSHISQEPSSYWPLLLQPCLQSWNSKLWGLVTQLTLGEYFPSQCWWQLEGDYEWEQMVQWQWPPEKAQHEVMIAFARWWGGRCRLDHQWLYSLALGAEPDNAQPGAPLAQCLWWQLAGLC